MSTPDRLPYSIPEAAKVVGIGRTTGYELINAGAWATFRVGRKVLIARTTLEKWVEAQHAPTAVPFALPTRKRRDQSA